MSRTRLKMDPAYDEIALCLIASYPDACICWIDAVANPDIQDKYDAYKREMSKMMELTLYHGTKKACIDAIIKEGFRISENCRSAYGRGTYFGVSALTSQAYSVPDQKSLSYMFVCKVLVSRERGRVGGSGMVPAAPGDHFVDSKDNPRMYVIGDDEAILPTHVVAFHQG